MPFRIRIPLLLLLMITLLSGEDELQRGHEIYRNLCAECHGPKGEGVADEYDEPLFGDRTIPDLAKLIHKTMPDYEPELCADDEALAVATNSHIHEMMRSFDKKYAPYDRYRSPAISVIPET